VLKVFLLQDAIDTVRPTTSLAERNYIFSLYLHGVNISISTGVSAPCSRVSTGALLSAGANLRILFPCEDIGEIVLQLF